uniref:Uncharacterized protein n=1 Tax=Panagrolaimus superbus TaxID=310955 RepID=A0A914ZD90_9BILA
MNSSVPDFFGTEDNVGINLLEVDVEAGQVLRQDGPESKIKAKRGRPRKYNTPEEQKAASDNRHLRCRQSKTQSEADEKFRQKGVKEVNEDLKQKYSKTIKKNKFLFKKYSETFYSSPNLNLLWNEPDEIEAYQIQIQNLENSCLSKVENLNYKNFDNACQKSREKKDLIKTKDEKTSEILGKLNKLYQMYVL